MKRTPFALAALLLSAAVAARDSAPAPRTLSVTAPWARATVAAAQPGGVFFGIRNDGDRPDRLLRVETPLAAKAELHESIVSAGVARMRPVGSIPVPARGRVALAPGGYHVMLWGLRRPLKAGERLPIAAIFEKAGRVEVEVDVKPLDAPGHTGAGHAH